MLVLLMLKSANKEYQIDNKLIFISRFHTPSLSIVKYNAVKLLIPHEIKVDF